MSRTTLRQRLDELEGIEGETGAVWCLPIVQPRAEVDEFGGYRRFDPDKLTEMMVFFSGFPDMFKTKLNKMLFYAGFLHCKEHTLEFVAARFRRRSSTALSELSHTEEAYTQTHPAGMISYRHAPSLSLSSTPTCARGDARFEAGG